VVPLLHGNVEFISANLTRLHRLIVALPLLLPDLPVVAYSFKIDRPQRNVDSFHLIERLLKPIDRLVSPFDRSGPSSSLLDVSHGFVVFIFRRALLTKVRKHPQCRGTPFVHYCRTLRA
jgi:hypothetical protein